MDKILNWIKKSFEVTHKVGCGLLKIRRNAFFEKHAGKVILVLFLLSGLLSLYVALKYVVLLLLLICFVIEVICDSNKFLLSIIGFLGIGLCYWVIFTCFIICFFTYFVNTGNNVLNAICSYSIVALMWWIYSLIANNKVANVANQILSALFALVVLMKDTMLAMMPLNVLEQEYIKGYTVEKIIEITSGFIFSPILAVNIIALVLCTLKGYWIEKYNDNMDIS